MNNKTLGNEREPKNNEYVEEQNKIRELIINQIITILEDEHYSDKNKFLCFFSDGKLNEPDIETFISDITSSLGESEEIDNITTLVKSTLKAMKSEETGILRQEKINQIEIYLTQQNGI